MNRSKGEVMDIGEKTCDSVSSTVTNNQQTVGDESLGEAEIKGFDGRVDIHVKSYRHRPTDPDDGGGSPKFLIDGLVDCGILTNDSAKEIRHFKKDQSKISQKEKEKVLVIITEVEDEDLC